MSEPTAGTETPAETLRRAAEKMRQRAEAAREDGWTEPSHVTSVHEAAEPYDGEELIVGCGKDHYDAEDPSVWTTKQYIADAEAESFAVFIAAMHPAVALYIAATWLSIAEDLDNGYLAPTTHLNALCAARAYLGEATP